VTMRPLLSAQQIREMHCYGIQFGSHTLTHPSLLNSSDIKLQREVRDSKARLEDLLDSEVTCFAYPFGNVDNRVRAAVADAGYKLGMTMRPGFNTWSDPLCLKRINVSESDTFIDFFLKVKTGRSFIQESFELSRLVLRKGVECLPEPFSKSVREIRTKLRDRLVPSHSRIE
jgi:peptidoglycan/xylan/chitin deacetylase (PgdA/CDA1 family)